MEGGGDALSSVSSKTKKLKVKHQKKKVYRSSDPLISVLMWGVNYTLRELEAISVPVMLMPDDFRAYSKIKIDNHAFNKENLPSHFKVKEYCPLVFRNLRERFGIEDSSYLRSLTRINPASIDSPGKSNAKFFLSHDQIYIIKTLTSEEVEQMHSLLKQYHPFIVERHGKTLLPQYLSMYRLTVDNVEHYLVVMRNVFSNHLKIHKKYDLKGSTVDREASQKERGKDNPTYKDNDFLSDGVKIVIGNEAKNCLMETLAADVKFLTKLHIMDYSLLLGVHDVEIATAERERQELLVDGEEQRDERTDEEYDSGGSGANHANVGSALTPPDSPLAPGRRSTGGGGAATTDDDEAVSPPPYYRASASSRINPEKDIYAIPSKTEANNQTKEIYFLALVDVLTHYGVKKQAAKAAKTVKYGSSVDGISTVEPDQYAKRFLNFMADAIE